MRRSVLIPCFGSACVQLEVEAPSVCVDAKEVALAVPEVPVLPSDEAPPVVIATEVVQDEMSAIPDELVAAVTFSDGHLAPSQGAAALTFVTGARVSLGSATDGGLPTVDLLSFERRAGDTAPDVAVLGLGEAVDLARYLGDGGAVFGIELTADPGALPDEIRFDANLCLSGVLSYEHAFLDDL
jgi:hypothetical protein